MVARSILPTALWTAHTCGSNCARCCQAFPWDLHARFSTPSCHATRALLQMSDGGHPDDHGHDVHFETADAGEQLEWGSRAGAAECGSRHN